MEGGRRGDFLRRDRFVRMQGVERLGVCLDLIAWSGKWALSRVVVAIVIRLVGVGCWGGGGK